MSLFLILLTVWKELIVLEANIVVVKMLVVETSSLLLLGYSSVMLVCGVHRGIPFLLCIYFVIVAIS